MYIGRSYEKAKAIQKLERSFLLGTHLVSSDTHGYLFVGSIDYPDYSIIFLSVWNMRPNVG